jgi:hypothetical protein
MNFKVNRVKFFQGRLNRKPAEYFVTCLGLIIKLPITGLSLLKMSQYRLRYTAKHHCHEK